MERPRFYCEGFECGKCGKRARDGKPAVCRKHGPMQRCRTQVAADVGRCSRHRGESS